MKSCTRHWWALRLSSLPLVPLFFFFLAQPSSGMLARDRGDFTAWLQQPAPAAASALFILCAFYHACLGMDEIFIDYVPEPGAQKAARLLNRLFFAVLGLAALYALAMIYMGNA